MELNIFPGHISSGFLIDLAILSVIFILQFHFLLSQFYRFKSVLFSSSGGNFVFSDHLGLQAVKQENLPIK